MITAIARHQVQALRRRRVLTAVVGTLLGVNALAGILGWASKATISGVYDESVKLLTSRNLTAPANPFRLKPPLAMLSNEVIYITMIGALVAIVLGHLVAIEERSDGIGRLVFCRRVTRAQFLRGKLLAVGAVLGGPIGGSMLLSVASVAVLNRSISASSAGRLVLFFAGAFVYLFAFTLVGMVASLITSRRSLGLLGAMGTWLIVTFAVPQFTSGLRPSQSLNPIVDPISTSQAFFRITAKARPISIIEQFKTASSSILATGTPEPAGTTLARFIPLVMVVVVLLAVLARRISCNDYARSIGD